MARATDNLKRQIQTCLLMPPKQRFGGCLAASKELYLTFFIVRSTLYLYGAFAVRYSVRCIMVKMSRAGRKAMMFKAIMAHDRKHPTGALTTAQMAHAAGLKSGSNVVKMLREMEAFGRIKEVQIKPKYDSEYTVRAWQLVHEEQLPLPERYIVINGVKWHFGGVGVQDEQQI